MKLYLCVSIALSLVGAALSSSLDGYDDLDAQYFPNDWTWTNMQGKQLQTRMHANLSKFIRLRIHPEYRALQSFDGHFNQLQPVCIILHVCSLSMGY